jgi:DNA-binding transcriptional MerR regulator/uncharacterized protein (DUF433 family)
MEHAGGGQIVGAGIYSLRQAARLSGVPVRSIRRWTQGYSYPYRGDVARQPPVIRPHLPSSAGEAGSVSFHDLLEIRFVHAFRELGVSWKVIRMAAEKARDLLETDHPFTTDAFFSDGRRIFADLQKQGIREKRLVDLVSDQYCFRNVMLPGFRAQLDLSDRGAQRWWPLGRKKKIVLDPARQFGQPIVSDQSVPTVTLAKAAAAMGSERLVAQWYDVPRSSVHQAVAFERQLAAT